MTGKMVHWLRTSTSKQMSTTTSLHLTNNLFTAAKQIWQRGLPQTEQLNIINRPMTVGKLHTPDRPSTNHTIMAVSWPISSNRKHFTFWLINTFTSKTMKMTFTQVNFQNISHQQLFPRQPTPRQSHYYIEQLVKYFWVHIMFYMFKTWVFCNVHSQEIKQIAMRKRTLLGCSQTIAFTNLHWLSCRFWI